MNMLTPMGSDTDTAHPARRRWQRTALIAAPIVLIGGVVLFSSHKAPAVAPPTPTVTVATPLLRQVHEWDDYVGRFEPSRSVEVRPRVSGQVTAVHFTDGALVQKGQLLFTIDPRPFAAALAEARAQVASAHSDVALAQANLARANRLSAEDAVSKGDLDTLTARLRAATASLAGAEARVRARALDVEFTQVRAPIAGRISDRRVDPGNLVAAGEGVAGSLLTTINALDPIYFSFDASEALYLKTLRAKREGAGTPVVQVRLQDEADYRWKGQLDFTDNGLDQKSGTIRGRAVIHNPSNFLTSGMFGNMRLGSGGTVNALLVPDESVQTDQARKTLLVVDPKGVIVVKPVTLGPVVDGLRVIRSGLAPNDRVVVSGLQAAAPGSNVQVRVSRIDTRVATAAPAASTPLAGEVSFAR